MSEDRFDSVWDAFEDTPEQAASMKVRSQFMMTIQEIVRGWGVTQAEAAVRLGVTQPRLNDLLRGRIDRFSLDALMDLASAAGLKVEWHLSPIAAQRLDLNSKRSDARKVRRAQP